MFTNHRMRCPLKQATNPIFQGNQYSGCALSGSTCKFAKLSHSSYFVPMNKLKYKSSIAAHRIADVCLKSFLPNTLVRWQLNDVLNLANCLSWSPLENGKALPWIYVLCTTVNMESWRETQRWIKFGGTINQKTRYRERDGWAIKTRKAVLLLTNCIIIRCIITITVIIVILSGHV